jgi:hypothetical protein
MVPGDTKSLTFSMGGDMVSIGAGIDSGFNGLI